MKKKIIAVFSILLLLFVLIVGIQIEKDIHKMKSKPLPLFSVYLESRGMRKMKSKS